MPVKKWREAHARWLDDGAEDDRLFREALRDPAAAQETLLLDILRRNADTAIGRYYHFDRIRTAREFQRAVPPRTYDRFEPWLRRAARGEPNVLTAEPIERFLPTHGTSDGCKWIPLTASLRADFLRGVRPWIASLYRAAPALRTGAFYWNIAPPVPRPAAHGVYPAGFEREADYLGPAGRAALETVSPLPPSATPDTDIETRVEITLSALLGCPALACISAWRPSYLLTLLDTLDRTPGPALRRLRASGAGRRADDARDILSAGATPDALRRLWPSLALVSCWMHGPSEPLADRLKARLPHVRLQAKGLLAVEAFVSLPYDDGDDPVPALRSHFLEFEEPGTGRVRLAHELEPGRDYAVLVTTGGGLYRYRLGDRIRATGRRGDVPRFRFAGREEKVSDLMGEKLTEKFARSCLQMAFRHAGLSPRFHLLAPAADRNGYILFAKTDPLDRLAAAARDLDRLLRRDPHYDQARRLGQLLPVRPFSIDPNGPDPAALLAEKARKASRRKTAPRPGSLDPDSGWSRRFRGSFLSP